MCVDAGCSTLNIDVFRSERCEILALCVSDRSGKPPESLGRLGTDSATPRNEGERPLLIFNLGQSSNIRSYSGILITRKRYNQPEFEVLVYV
jgi:hypothetical protein